MQKSKRSPIPTPLSTLFFVSTQLVLVVIASASMSRCSPLAPSEQLGAAASPPISSESLSGPRAAAEASRRDLALQLNAVRNTLVTQSVVTDAQTEPQAAPNSVVLVLSEEQRIQLYHGNVIDISIIENLKSQRLNDDAARARFLSVRAIPEAQIQIKLISYILRERNISERMNAGSFSLAMNDLDGLVRVHNLPDLVKHGVRQGYTVVLEISQK